VVLCESTLAISYYAALLMSSSKRCTLSDYPSVRPCVRVPRASDFLETGKS